MFIAIEDEEEEEGNECFDDKLLYLRRKRKREVSLEQMKKRKFMVGYHLVNLNVLPSNYQFPLMTCSQLIVDWLLGSVSENVFPIWNLSYKELNCIKNGTRMWKIMKRLISEVKRVAIDKVCRKYKMKDWDYMSAIKVWDNVQNYFNIKYMADKKKRPLTKDSLQSHVIFKYISESKECTLKNSSLTIIQNKLKIKYFLIVLFLLLSKI